MTTEQDRLRDVRFAMQKLQGCVELVAMDPKNVDKGGWALALPEELFVHAVEELGEVANAIRKGKDLHTISKEIGDAAWCLAMLLDRLHCLEVASGKTSSPSTSAVAFIGELLAASPEERPAHELQGCHLPLKLLDADDVCPRCGCLAVQHRNWEGR